MSTPTDVLASRGEARVPVPHLGGTRGPRAPQSHPARRSRGERFATVDQAILRAQAGDGEAFAFLYRRYAGLVAGYLRAQRATDPDGAANEVFLRAFRHMGRFRGWEPDLRSWLVSIAHNLVLDERRRAARHPTRTAWEDVGELLERQRSLDASSDDHSGRAIGEAYVGDQLARLAPDQRDVLVLRIVGDLSLEQTAEVLGKRVGAVKSLQKRGLDALRRNVVRDGVPAGLRDDRPDGGGPV